MIGYSGMYSLVAMLLIALPFIMSAFIFRVLNQHFPQAGASYHWSARMFGARASRFQGWVIILAYFASLPPIVLPAAQYTIALLHPTWQDNRLAQFSISTFWLVFASIPLLLGARITARVTQVFLAVEILFLLVFAALGIMQLPHAHFPAWPKQIPVSGILLTMVVATTIFDGWEIDSYASEEAINPRKDPGLGGIIGAIAALVVYGLLFPLIIGETPMAELTNSPDPLVAWATHLVMIPSILSKSILIPILASTAGSLWLTGYILIRALFAMGRDLLLPRMFAHLNRHGAPATATILVFAVLWAITMLQLLVTSLDTFFTVLLSTAGFFLTLEFMLDSLTATVFLWKQHQKRHAGTSLSHSHGGMCFGSAATTLYLFSILVAFFILSPRVLSPWSDVAVSVLLLAGIVFTYSRTGKGNAHTFAHFEEEIALIPHSE